MMKRRAAILLCFCTALAAHAQVRISELPQATNTAGAQFVIVQGSTTKRIAESLVRTIPATNVTGLGPFAISTNLAISNVSGLQGALDAKLGTNGTLPAGNISGLGPFATAINLSSGDISDFSNAVVAVSPSTTNASLLTSGTLDDARISTNIARISQLFASNISGLGPFAIATNLLVANVDGLQAALDGKLATNGTLPSGNISGLGPFATATNLTAAQIGDFSNAVVAVAPPTTNASLLTSGTIEDARLSTNIARTSQLVASNITGLGPFATASNLVSSNLSDFSNAVVAVSPPTTPTTNASLLTTGTLPDERLSTNVRNHIGLGWSALTNSNAATSLLGTTANGTVLSGTNVLTLTNTARSPAWLLSAIPTNGIATISTNQYGMGWDELGRFTLQTPVGAMQLYSTGNPSVPTFYWPGKIISQSFEAISVSALIKASSIFGGESGGNLSAEIMNGSMPTPLYQWLRVNAIPSGIPATEITNETSPANYFDMTPGAYFPVAVVTNVEDAANEIYGAYQTPAQVRSNLALGPFATAPNLEITNVSGLQSALDGKLATNGTLAISNVSGLQGALDAKLATNGTLHATNITGLGPYAVATNLSSVDISDFSNAVVSFAPPTTNAASLTTGTLADARLSTNVAFLANLGPFAAATNLQISNVGGLQGALDGKLATNGMLPATNITGLGPYAIATNLSSSDISNFSNSVVALFPTNSGTATTNASDLTSGTLNDARLSTNVVFTTNAALTNARPVAWVAVPSATNSTGTFGDAALTNNFLYVCVGSNQWRRVLLGTW